MLQGKEETEHSRGSEMKMLGEMQNMQVTVTFGEVAGWHSSSFVSCSFLICAFVFCSSFSPDHRQYFDDNVIFSADYLPEITDNVSLDSPDQDLIVNWSRSGKRNKSLLCWDVSGASLQPWAPALLTDL